MEKRREKYQQMADRHLAKVKLKDDVCIEVGGPGTQVATAPNGAPQVEVGFCFLLTLGHNLLGKPPITFPGIVPAVEIPEQMIEKIVDQLLEGARRFRAEMQGVGGEFGGNLRQNPIKLG